MEDKKIKTLEKFVNERLPEAERDRVIMIIDDKELTWRQVLAELKKGGAFAKKVERRFEEITE